MRIAVLAGGLSPEHDVSMKSGCGIAAALAGAGHTVALCDIMRDVSAQEYARYSVRTDYEHTIPDEPYDVDAHRCELTCGSLTGEGLIPFLRQADLVFMALYGGMGEDGRAQALLDCYGIGYTGGDSRACHLAMDKYLTKLIFSGAGIGTPDGILYDGTQPRSVIDAVGLPAVVKPRSNGSSIGVHFAYTREELNEAIEKSSIGDGLIIEELIVGREFTVSVLCDTALPVVEIIPHGGAFDFKSKYTAGMTDEICPAPIDKNTADTLCMLALKAHNVLGLRECSRTDFIMSEDGTIYALETNALPGMTPTSLMPLAAAAEGIDYTGLCERICAAALERIKNDRNDRH